MNKKIVNLTQHSATSEQISAGVFDLEEKTRARLTNLLTFPELPTEQEILSRARDIALLASTEHSQSAMIGGALWLMSPLAIALKICGIEPLFAFSIRETIEERLPDDSVKKVMVFRHAGFIPAI
jgi:hypothetical protein